MKKGKLFLGRIILVALIMVVFFGCSAKEESGDSKTADSANSEKIYKFTGGVVPQSTNPTSIAMMKFAEIVEEKTNGKVLLTVLTDAQLGGERELLESVQLGTVDFSNITTTIVANSVPEYLVFDLPFLFGNEEDVYAYFDSTDGRGLLKSLESKNMVGIGYLNNGFRVTTSNIPIRSADDVVGLSIRTMENEIHLATWRSLGAQPTPLAFQDLYTALQQGVIGAQENPISVIKSAGFYNIQKYISETNHINSMTVTMFNKEKWDSLPGEYQKLIMEAQAEVEQFDRQNKAKANAADLESMIAAGTTVIKSDEIDFSTFREKVKTVYALYEDKVGKDLLESIFK